MIKLVNAFSVQMLNNFDTLIQFKEISKDEAAELLQNNEFESYIGHSDTVTVINNELNIGAMLQRKFAKINSDDILVIAQFVGGRLPEGCCKLPDNIELKYITAQIILK